MGLLASHAGGVSSKAAAAAAGVAAEAVAEAAAAAAESWESLHTLAVLLVLFLLVTIGSAMIVMQMIRNGHTSLAVSLGFYFLLSWLPIVLDVPTAKLKVFKAMYAKSKRRFYLALLCSTGWLVMTFTLLYLIYIYSSDSSIIGPGPVGPGVFVMGAGYGLATVITGPDFLENMADWGRGIFY